MLRQIKYFMTVVDCGSFTEAAEQCYVSQSAISQQINALEEELGVKLLKRERRKFTLTAAGEYLYQEGRALLDMAEKLRRETVRVGSDSEARLRIGYLESYQGKPLEEAVSRFTALYPEVILTAAKYSHQDLFTTMSEDELDMVLSYQRRAFSQHYVNLHLRYVPCVIQVSRQSPLAKEPALTPEKLQEHPCILVAKPEQQELEQQFFQNALNIPGSTYRFVKNLGEAHLAVAGNHGFFPTADLGGEEEDGSPLVKLPFLQEDGSPVHFHYCAFWKKSRSNYYMEEFASLFRQIFAPEEA